MAQIKKQLMLDEDNVNWFYSKHGEDASLGWLCDLLLTKYREVCEKTPIDYATLGAQALKDELDAG